MKKPTIKEELLAWQNLAFELNFARQISMDNTKIIECLNRIDYWVNAHSEYNGERDNKSISENITDAFWKHIHK
jgi:hypothetical protein